MPEDLFVQRKNIRLRDYDYSSPGAYMVTICANGRQERPFGVMRNGEVELSDIGQIVAERWKMIPEHFTGVGLDIWTIMPDHFHGILLFQMSCSGEASLAPTTSPVNGELPALGTVVGSFKSGVSRVAKKSGATKNALWQRGYFEHVIRNQNDLERAREYINLNPLRLAEECPRCP